MGIVDEGMIVGIAQGGGKWLIVEKNYSGHDREDTNEGSKNEELNNGMWVIKNVARYTLIVNSRALTGDMKV